MDVVDVLDRIRNLSEERGFTQYKLSELSGVPQSTIYNMFKRRTMPKLDNLDKICVALDISMSDFFSAHSKPAEDGYITEDEQQLLWISRNLSKKNQEQLQSLWLLRNQNRNLNRFPHTKSATS